MSETNGNGTNGHGSLPPNGQPMARPICGANKRKGGTCQSTVLYANGRCKLHGGAAVRGIASGSYKHGRYSKYMPAHIVGRYEASLNDPELTVLRDEIALIDTLLGEKLDMLHAGESGRFWEKLREEITAYRLSLTKAASDGYSGREPDEILTRIEQLAARGDRVFDTFVEIQPILEQRRKVTETENKRAKDLNQTLTAEQAVAFARQLGDSVKRNVSNPKEVQAVFDDLARILA